MHVKPLNIQYRLIGKNIPPTEVSSARSVEAALRENGLLCDRFSGMGVFEEEWVKRREFALEGEFDIGEWDCERTYVEFEWIRGQGRVLLNDVMIGEFLGGPKTFDAAEAVREGVNRIRIEFSPEEEWEPRPGRGVWGGVNLRGCWSLNIMYFELAPRDFGVLAQVAVDSHSAGRYIFRYVVSKDGEMIDTLEFEHQLGAKHATVEHELKLNVQPQDCRVLLTVLRAGAECDAREGWTRICQSDEPLGTGRFLAPGEVTTPSVAFGNSAFLAEKLEQLLEAGISMFYAQSGTYLPESFLRKADEAGAHVVTTTTPMTPHACVYPPKCAPSPTFEHNVALRRLDAPERPIPRPALCALGGELIVDMPVEGTFGEGALGDIARLSRVTRYLQAQYTARAVERGNAAFDIGDTDDAIASWDLFDGDAARPAYYALRHALREVGVYADGEMWAHNPGEQIALNVFVRGGAFERVTAEVFELDGRLVSRAAFADCVPGCVGEIAIAPGGECRALLARISGLRGGEMFLRDYPIILRGGFEYEALMRMPPATIRRTGDKYENTSGVIAFGPIRSDGGSALLPGEVAALDSAEGVNIFMYEAIGG